MNAPKMSFADFLIAKGVLDMTRLHPNELKVWRSAYAVEVLGVKTAHVPAVESNPDELLLKCEPGDSQNLVLRAGAELAEMTFEAEPAEGNKLPTFSMTAYNGGPMYPSGWYEDHPIVIDLAGMQIAQTLPIDADHWHDIGHTTQVEKTAKSLRASGVLSAYSPDAADQDSSAAAARRIRRMGANGFPFQASITPSVLRSKIAFYPAGESVKVNGRTISGPVSVARQSTLKKIAILSLGADSTTSTSIAASLQGRVPMGFEQWVQAAGFDLSTMSANEVKILRAMFDGDQQRLQAAPTTPVGSPPANPTAPTIDIAAQVREAIAGERTRVREIEAATEGLTLSAAHQTEATTLRAKALAGEMDLAALNAGLIALIRQDRAAPTVIVHAHEQTCTRDSLQGAMLLRSGIALDSRHFATPQAVAMNIPSWLRAGLNTDQRQQAMEAAHMLSSMSMIDVARECIRLDGRAIPHSRDSIIEAAFSGGTLTNVFTTNVNTIVLARYMESGDTTGAWTRTVDVADFKTNERPRLEKGGGLQKLPRGKAADDRSYSDVGESYRIARYAEKFTVDDQDMIDDNFGVLTDVPRDMADDAARLRPDLVYGHLMSNPTLAATGRALFNATDANLATTTALSGPNLKAAISAMNLITENGVNIDVTPTHFIGPPSLDFTIRELLNSTQIVLAGTAGSVTERGNVNTLTGLLTPVIEKRLENGLTDPASGMKKSAYAGSSSTWYIASTRVDTIEVAYLRGTGRAPQVRSYKLGEGKWGVGFDVKLDIGCKAMGWHGLRKHTA